MVFSFGAWHLPWVVCACLAGSSLALHNRRLHTATSSMTRMSATPEGENASSKSAEEDEKTSEMMAQIFGSNLQVTVWVCTLSYAGYTGYQQMQVDPSSVGMLLAPPLGALALMTSFGLFYSAKIASQKDAAAALAAKRAAEEAEEAK